MTSGAPGGPDDTVLISRVVAGDAEAFRLLYRRHAPALYRMALAFTGGSEADASDVMQETWMRAVRSLDRFEGRSTLRTWLRGIASRCAAERHRRVSRDHERFEEGSVAAGRGPAVATQVDLERIVEGMPPGFRTVLLLYDLEGYRHAEIGEMLGISTGTSKSQLSRARRWVRDALGEDYESS